MTNTIQTPYLGITISNNLQDPFPVWGLNTQNALLAFDRLLGNGVATGIIIPTSSILINADLSFGNYNITNVRALRLQNLTSVPSLGSDVCELVAVGNDGYWINGLGTAVRITEGSSIVPGAEQYQAKLSVSGNYTILTSDPYGWYDVNTTSVASTINLPSNSALNAGRRYKFSDFNGNSETNSITLIPNGTDTINGSNSNVVFQHNYGDCSLVADGAGHWSFTQSGESFIRQNKIVFSAGTTIQATGITQAPASGAGSSFTISAQSAAGSNNTGGSITIASGAKTGSGYDGYIYFQAGNTVEAFILSTDATSAGGLGIGSTPGTDPTISRGTGIPSTTQPNGSLFLRTDGTNASAIYVRESGVWSAIAPGLSAPVVAGVRTITGSYTVDNSGNDYLIYLNSSSAFNLTLPAPTLGRVIVVKDVSGALETNPCTLVRHGSENIEGLAASRVLQTNFGSYTITSSDGSNWQLLS
jgi:hypothetical protein